MANVILKNGVGTPIEYKGIETIEVPQADVTIVPETEFSGFAYEEDFGLYIVDVNPSPITLEVGENYAVVWDGVAYDCSCQDLSTMAEGVIGIGNLANFGGIGNDEPFIIVIVDGVAMCASPDEGESHTITLNKKGGTQIFSEGVAVEMPTPIPLDFSNGNQTITAPEGYLVKSAILQKPNALVPENIAKDVKIAGIVGTHEGGGSALSPGVYWEAENIIGRSSSMQRWFDYNGDRYLMEYVSGQSIHILYKYIDGAWTVVNESAPNPDLFKLPMIVSSGKAYFFYNENKIFYVFDGTNFEKREGDIHGAPGGVISACLYRGSPAVYCNDKCFYSYSESNGWSRIAQVSDVLTGTYYLESINDELYAIGVSYPNADKVFKIADGNVTQVGTTYNCYNILGADENCIIYRANWRRTTPEMIRSYNVVENTDSLLGYNSRHTGTYRHMNDFTDKKIRSFNDSGTVGPTVLHIVK